MLKESGDNEVAHLTFFGGETLLNFPVLKRTIAYARQRAAEVGKKVDFSLTTNATLLRPEIIEFLAENDVGVTISIDGPREVQDKFRVFHNGTGSYDVVAPKIKELLERHRSRPIGARVTLTSATLDVKRIYRHLTEEIGFWEVGFAPVTTVAGRATTRSRTPASTTCSASSAIWPTSSSKRRSQNRHHGFSNVKETLEEIHKGMSKAYPVRRRPRAAWASRPTATSRCATASPARTRTSSARCATASTARRSRRSSTKHHIANKTDCSTCWARPLCSGGCYHEAHTRYGETTRPNLHYCEWIRGWTDVCLQIYGELAERNPAFLAQFDERACER